MISQSSPIATAAAALARRKLLVFLVFLLAAFAAYFPVLSGEFVWDDTFLVGKNPFFKSPVFVFEVFRHWLFLDSFSGYYRPVQNWSYILDYLVWNRDPFGYHLTNLVLHAIAAWLLLLTLSRLLGTLWPESSPERRDAFALLVALLWTIHPIHNAAVAYIAGRADTLAMIFVLSAWLACLRACATVGFPRILHLALAWACALLGLLSKEIAIVWFAFFVATILSFSPWMKPKQKALILLGLLAVIGAYLALRLQLPARVAQPSTHDALATRALMALRALGDYGTLIFWPGNLHMERLIYQPDLLSSAHTWPQWASFQRLTFAGGLVLAFFAAGVAWKSPGQRLRVWAVLWFVIGFLPISNLFPLNAQSAEHWIYMPSIGFLLFLVSMIFDAPPRLSRSLTAVTVLALIPLTARTALRSQDWRTPAQFYTRTIEQGGGSWRTHMNLAVQYIHEGNIPKAEALLRKTLEHTPIVTVKISLGLVLALEHKNEEARTYLVLPLDQLPAILKEHPNNWQACLRVAADQAAAGKTDDALALLEKAREIRPDVWDLFKLQNQILAHAGRTPQAISNVRQYVQENWWHYESHILLAQLLTTQGSPDEAVAELQAAARLDIHAGEPLAQIAGLELAQKHLPQALAAAQRAIARSGGLPSGYLQLARIYDAMNEPKKAEEAFQIAHRMSAEKKPDDLGGFL